MAQLCAWDFPEINGKVLAHYQFLAKWSMETPGKEYRYSVVPKHYSAAHFEAQAKFLAPRMSWTYPGETFMGLIASLFQACARGRPSHIISKAVFHKYCLAKHLKLSGLLDIHQELELDICEETLGS